VLGAKARPIIFVVHSTGGVLVKEVTAMAPSRETGLSLTLTAPPHLRGRARWAIKGHSPFDVRRSVPWEPPPRNRTLRPWGCHQEHGMRHAPHRFQRPCPVGTMRCQQRDS
jgi:hypothetical protein